MLRTNLLKNYFEVLEKALQNSIKVMGLVSVLTKYKNVQPL